MHSAKWTFAWWQQIQVRMTATQQVIFVKRIIENFLYGINASLSTKLLMFWGSWCDNPKLSHYNVQWWWCQCIVDGSTVSLIVVSLSALSTWWKQLTWIEFIFHRTMDRKNGNIQRRSPDGTKEMWLLVLWETWSKMHLRWGILLTVLIIWPTYKWVDVPRINKRSALTIGSTVISENVSYICASSCL